jgi:hypothetical protein
MDGRTPAEERELVQALMRRGWYRDGRDDPDDRGKCVWRFRSGHSIEALQRLAIGVRARSQRTAMRELLKHLDRERNPSLIAPSPPL